VQEYKSLNDRIIYIQVKAIPENVSVTQVFAPSFDGGEEEIEQFYEHLCDTITLTLMQKEGTKLLRKKLGDSAWESDMEEGRN
jgi:hypothetical protein